jgi:hypothetical protein
MEKFIPHIHKCEIKLCFPNKWKDMCILKGALTESEDECEQCKHFITLNFDPEQPIMITGIIRENTLIVAERQSAYKPHK